MTAKPKTRALDDRHADLAEIAVALGLKKRAAEMRASRGAWPYEEIPHPGHPLRLYLLTELPAGVSAAVHARRARHAPVAAAPIASLSAAEVFSYDPEALWSWAATRPQKLRDRGALRARSLMQVLHLVSHGQTFGAAAQAVAQANDESAANLRNWYYGKNSRPGARNHDIKDWAAALIPGYVGRQTKSEIPSEAWDWFLGHYLTRRQPALANSYRRVSEVARERGWTIPCGTTFARRVESEVSVATRVFLREGAEALARLYPQQRRDKTVFAAGEAVSGDGLKFDELWVRWPDGEIINTSTGWFWGDIRTNKIIAWRLAKTENTDLFRLATYDLTAICLPRYAQVDNTVVAANKAMTGRAPGRHRFQDRSEDPMGLLGQLGIDVHFTLPDMEKSNPGAKPIERSFGIGGIHHEVATHPDFTKRGYSKATAIPYEEFARVVAAEVTRFNARTKRNTPVCRGVLSFDQAFAESFSTATVRRATQAQRDLLLLMPEVVRASSESGEIRLKAGRGPHGKNRYWVEALTEFKGQTLVAYYDPENLKKAIAVYTLDGRLVCRADHMGDIAFNDMGAGREWLKSKTRVQKLQKKTAHETTRMDDIVHRSTYPQPEAPEAPPPGIVQGHFGQKRMVVNGEIVDMGTGEILENEKRRQDDDHFIAAVKMLKASEPEHL